MARSRRVLTDEQREQQRAQQRELVIASIEQLRTSDGWQAYLHARARFPSYSWRNVLLILSQHPTAERVAGFRAWLELGYFVTKGSTGIRIWARCAPSPKRMRAWRKPCCDHNLQCNHMAFQLVATQRRHRKFDFGRCGKMCLCIVRGLHRWHHSNGNRLEEYMRR